MIILVPLVLVVLMVVGLKWVYTRMNLISRLSTASTGVGVSLYQVVNFLLPHTQWHEWHYAAGALAGLLVFFVGTGFAAWRVNSL